MDRWSVYKKKNNKGLWVVKGGGGCTFKKYAKLMVSCEVIILRIDKIISGYEGGTAVTAK